MSGWETVGKKNNLIKKKNSKDKVKQFHDNAPKLERLDPFKEDVNAFDVVAPKEESIVPKTVPFNKKGSNSPKLQAKQPKKSSTQSNKSRKQTFAECILKLNISEVRSILTKDKDIFANNPEIWLLDIISYLNTYFGDIPENDPIFADEAFDYPYNKVPKQLDAILSSVVNQCSKKICMDVFFDSVRKIITEMSKGQSTYGYRIFIQYILFKHNPNLVLEFSKQFQLLFEENEQHSLRCLVILWIVGQCGQGSLKSGLQAWFSLMLPKISNRGFADYTLTYVEKLFQWHKNILTTAANDSITFEQYVQVLDIAYEENRQVNLPANFYKRLRKQCAKIKQAVVYGSNSQDLGRFLFPYLLSRLQTSVKIYREELLKQLLHLLTVDQYSFVVWIQLYPSHYKQSSILLNYLCENWNLDEQSELVTNHLLNTIAQFKNFLSSEKVFPMAEDKVHLDNVENVEKKLIKRRRRRKRGCCSRLFLSILVIGAGFIAYDLVTSPNIEKSKTALFIHETGWDSVISKIYQQIAGFFHSATSWVESNYPGIYVPVADCATIVWKMLAHGAKTAGSYLHVAGNWAFENLPAYYSSVCNWWSGSAAREWTIFGFEKAVNISQPVISTVQPIVSTGLSYVTSLCNWFSEYVFVGKLSPEHLKNYTIQSIDFVHEQTIKTLKAISKLYVEINATASTDQDSLSQAVPPNSESDKIQ